MQLHMMARASLFLHGAAITKIATLGFSPLRRATAVARQRSRGGRR
jgi:hypothetical protein